MLIPTAGKPAGPPARFGQAVAKRAPVAPNGWYGALRVDASGGWD